MNASAHLLVSSAHRLGPCVDQWFASLAAHQNHLLSFQKKKKLPGPSPRFYWSAVVFQVSVKFFKKLSKQF